MSSLKYEPWRGIPELDWDDDNEKEVWAHRVNTFEVEQCFENAHITYPHPKARSQPERYRDRYIVRGSTGAGRKLVIVVQYLGSIWVRPITAWDDKGT